MGQQTESELIEAFRNNPTGFFQKITPHEPDVPLIISKKWLCVHYGLQSSDGRMNYARLYRLVLNPRVISAIGMTEAEIRRKEVKEFDAVTSRLLKNVLGL